MLGPSILIASSPPALTEGVRAVRSRGQRLLGGIALLVAFPAMALVLPIVGGALLKVGAKVAGG